MPIRFPKRISSLKGLLMLVCALGLFACSNDGITPENINQQPGAMTEEHDRHAVTWVMNSDGAAHAVVRTRAGALVSDVVGKLTAAVLGDRQKPQEFELEADDGVLSADLGKLEAPVTQVRYTLKAEDKNLVGVLHVPKGGTQELNEEAETAEKAKLSDKKGPHGGVVQVVGEDVVEIVGNKKNGEVRVYLLDDALKPVAVGERKLKLVSVDKEAEVEVVVLEPDEKKTYFVGKLTAKTNPNKLTVVIEDKDEVNVALCHHRPGHVVAVGHHAPPLVVLVVDSWHPQVVHVNHRVHFKGKGKGRGKGWGHFKHKHKHKHGKIQIEIH